MQFDLLQQELLPPEKQTKRKRASGGGVSATALRGKAVEAFRTISETADLLGVEQHVLRFWESKFPQIRPLKLRGGRRYYRPEDIEALATIRQLLYSEGYTIKGAKKAFQQASRMSRENREENMSLLQQELLPMPEQPAPSAKPARPPAARPALASRQREELLAIRQELTQLREMLRGYL